MIRRPPRSTLDRSSAASDVYKRQRKDNGGEWNGEPNGISAGNAPIGNFEIYNATYIGAGTNATGGRAFISREYAAPKVFNSIFTEFNAGGNIDDKSGLH